MLSFPKSHKIEEMIQFQLSWRGNSQEDFLEKIQHKLETFVTNSKSRTDTTLEHTTYSGDPITESALYTSEFAEVSAPFTSLN